MSLNLLEGEGESSGSGGSGAVDHIATSSDNQVEVEENVVDVGSNDEYGGVGNHVGSDDGIEGSDMEMELCIQSTVPTSARINSNNTTAASVHKTTTTTATHTTPHTAYPNHTTTIPIPRTTATNTTTNTTSTTRTKLSKHTIAANKAAARQEKRQLENARIGAMAACAPKCPGHSMPSKLLVVKKSGANKVRDSV